VVESVYVQDSYADWLAEVNFYVRQATGYELHEIAPLDYSLFRDAGVPAAVTAERAIAGDDHWWGLQ
jgi:hypothetical protein